MVVNNYPNDCFQQASVRSGLWIDQLKVVQRNGARGVWGGNGGNSNAAHFQGGCMSGIWGKSGSLIDSMGFYYTQIPKDMLGNG